MLEHAQKKDVGAVGSKLLYPNNTIQHAGVIVGIGGVAGHASLGLHDETTQIFPVLNSKDIIRNFSAVTAACLLISKSKYKEVGGLDAKFRIAFNDVDFCLKLRERGYYNVYTPFSKLYHHESISVGKPQDGTRDIKEFNNEAKMMKDKWQKYIQNDPFYNPNMDSTNPYFFIKIK
jgi:GT2 family glycosyltransferase